MKSMLKQGFLTIWVVFHSSGFFGPYKHVISEFAKDRGLYVRLPALS